MKYLFFVFFIFIVSCNSGKKNYVCGDRPCVDKKDFKEFFAENLTIEIKSNRSNKKKNIDLVSLNTSTISKNEDIDTREVYDEKFNKKDEKARLKAISLRLKEERKLKKINEKKRINEQKKLTKLNKKNNKSTKNLSIKNQENKNLLETVIESDNQVKKSNKKDSIKLDTYKSVKSKNNTSLCDTIKDCDIDKIADLLIKKNNKKDFPNISLK